MVLPNEGGTLGVPFEVRGFPEGTDEDDVLDALLNGDVCAYERLVGVGLGLTGVGASVKKIKKATKGEQPVSDFNDNASALCRVVVIEGVKLSLVFLSMAHLLGDASTYFRYITINAPSPPPSPSPPPPSPSPPHHHQSRPPQPQKTGIFASDISLKAQIKEVGLLLGSWWSAIVDLYCMHRASCSTAGPVQIMLANSCASIIGTPLFDCDIIVK